MLKEYKLPKSASYGNLKNWMERVITDKPLVKIRDDWFEIVGVSYNERYFLISEAEEEGNFHKLFAEDLLNNRHIDLFHKENDFVFKDEKTYDVELDDFLNKLKDSGVDVSKLHIEPVNKEPQE